MIDIWYYLTQIATADFGWKIRRPMRVALNILMENHDLEFPDPNIDIVDNEKVETEKYGDDVINIFLDFAIALRSAYRNSNADAPIQALLNDLNNYCDGSNVRYDIYRILKSFAPPNYVTDMYETIRANNSVIVMAGNESHMFMLGNHTSDSQTGICIAPPEGGFVEGDGYIVKVTNLRTGEYFESDLTIVGHGSPYLSFWDNDLMTIMMTPGIIKIEAICDDPNKAAEIYTDVCRFGNREPERYIPVSEADFTKRTIDNSTICAAKYLGSEERILMPSRMNTCTVTTISNSCFMDTNVTAVKIPEGVTTIE